MTDLTIRRLYTAFGLQQWNSIFTFLRAGFVGRQGNAFRSAGTDHVKSPASAVRQRLSKSAQANMKSCNVYVVVDLREAGSAVAVSSARRWAVFATCNFFILSTNVLTALYQLEARQLRCQAHESAGAFDVSMPTVLDVCRQRGSACRRLKWKKVR